MAAEMAEIYLAVQQVDKMVGESVFVMVALLEFSLVESLVLMKGAGLVDQKGAGLVASKEFQLVEEMVQQMVKWLVVNLAPRQVGKMEYKMERYVAGVWVFERVDRKVALMEQIMVDRWVDVMDFESVVWWVGLKVA